MNFMNSFSQADLIIIWLCFLVLAYIGCRNYRQGKFVNKIKSWSQDIITYSAKPIIISIDWPITVQWKHQVPPYYDWVLEFIDQWWSVRNKWFKFLEEILPQEIIDTINQIKQSEENRNWVDEIWLESSEIKNKRLDVVKQWLLKTIWNDIEVRQDSVEQEMIFIDDPLEKFNWEDNNNAQEKRFNMPRRAWFIFSAICFWLLQIFKSN